MNLNKLEDDLNFLVNGRRPHFFGKWKTTSIFGEMKEDLNLLENGGEPHLFGKCNWNLGNGRRPQFKRNWDTT